MSEHALAAALDTLVERFDDERGDWIDVLRRADASPAPRRGRQPGRTRRAAVVAVAITVLALVTLVSTASGRDALSSLLAQTRVDFWSSDPAPQPVRWRFADLSFGRPSQLDPQAIAAQSRTVGALVVRGRERTLWVAPTRRGGFCWIVGRVIRQCLGPSREFQRITGGLSFGYRVISEPDTGGAVTLDVDGLVFGDEIERVTVEFANGESESIDFVYVSEPIDAGFFSYRATTERLQGKGRVSAVVARNDAGEVVVRQLINLRQPPSRKPRWPIFPRKVEPLHLGPAVVPSPPLLRGTANGVSFTVGTNSAVLVDLTRIEPGRRALLGRSMNYSCFEVPERNEMVGGGGVSGPLQPTVGFELWAPTTIDAIDACEVAGSYGHRWPGRLGNHNVIEVPFTEKGRRFFHDRAAARDVSYFLRQTEMSQRRRTSSHLSSDEVRSAFGSSIAALPSRTATPPAGKIGYWADGSGLLLRRISSTGRRFEVVVGPKGGVIAENLEPYAIVF
jgi:hypothetical protein